VKVECRADVQHQRHADPGNTYLTISERPAWEASRAELSPPPEIQEELKKDASGRVCT
jgi:hypothetical protein